MTFLIKKAIILAGGQGTMLRKDVFLQLAEQGKLFGYHDPGQWFDTGTPERYQQTNQEWQLS
jgi:NDP-sugar pyrophosphorylase family protein